MSTEHTDGHVLTQYELLNILDGKASALLAFNAIALAAISIWLGYVPLNFMHLALDLVFIALLVSCWSLLRIVWLRWVTADDSVQVLDDVRAQRTGYYRFAWRLSICSVVALIAVSVTHTVGTAMVATGLCGDACEWFFGEGVFGNLDYGSTP